MFDLCLDSVLARVLKIRFGAVCAFRHHEVACQYGFVGGMGSIYRIAERKPRQRKAAQAFKRQC